MTEATKKERYKIIPEVYLILIERRKILLSLRQNTGYEDGKWSMVAGHAEENETMREALAREAKEEVGLVIDPEHLFHRLTMHRNCEDHARIAFFFEPKSCYGDVKNLEPLKCGGLEWFDLNALPENTIPYIRFAIGSCLTKVAYSEYKWPEKELRI